MNQTLVAAANGDSLVALEISPTFTNGAFTGVTNFAIRTSGGISAPIYTAAANLRLTSGTFTQPINFYLNLTSSEIARFHGTTGNLTLQNGGTFTDAGFRLDVVGADSRFNGIRAGLGAGQVASNTVFGNGALNANTTGAQNTTIGFEALKNCTNSNNTAIGYQSGLALNTGSNNVLIGTGLTCSSNTDTSVAIGSIANSTGNSNLIFGFAATSGGFNASVVLGRAATATASNQFVVGSTSYNAGAVTTEVNASTQVWNVIINGTARKILLA
jgi:hypothetical protein